MGCGLARDRILAELARVNFWPLDRLDSTDSVLALRGELILAIITLGVRALRAFVPVVSLDMQSWSVVCVAVFPFVGIAAGLSCCVGNAGGGCGWHTPSVPRFSSWIKGEEKGVLV